MANRELVLGSKHDSSFRQRRACDFAEAHTLLMAQSHDIGGLGETNEHVLNLAQSDFNGLSSGEGHGLDPRNVENCGLSLEQIYDHEEVASCTQKDDITSNAHDSDCNDEKELASTKHEDGMSLCLANDHCVDQDSIESNDLQIQLADENNEPGLSESHDFSGCLQLHLDQGQEMAIVPAANLDVPAAVIQSRIIPAPDHELHVGQEFPDVKSCRRALRDTAIALHFEIQTVKSDKTRFTAKCASEGCPWRIHAAKLPGVPTFTIRTLNNNHTCGGITHLGHQQASVQWVASSVEQRLRENPDFRPKDILEEIHRDYGIALSYKQAWRGKERILAAVRGSFEEDYRLLPRYCDQILQTNPGSIAKVYRDPVHGCFQRLFVSFHASIYGFLNGCRPLLGLDRAVLKSKYVATLLLASSFDGEGAPFPLAFGVVDEESDDNWMWFLSELHNLLESNTENMPKLTILSDRHKGIVEGVELNFPTAFHGFCMQHLSDTFSKEFNNQILVNLLWEAACALTVVEFEAKMLEIEEISPEAAYWIRTIPPRLWATAYFEGTRFGQLRANVVDSLNTWILEASALPIIQMMECIRKQLMTWFNERREVSMQWTSLLVPTAERQVSEAIECARTYQVFRADEAEFEVISHEARFFVDIRNRRCFCNGWPMYGLPCPHAVAALLSCRQNVHRFAEGCFTVTSYRNAYSETIHPIPDKTLWGDVTSGTELAGNGGNVVVINPPKLLRSPPQQKKKRRVRSENQSQSCGKRVVHCGRCNQTGHFRSTCGAPL